MTDKTIHIIKVGGNIIDNPAAMAQFIKLFAQYPAGCKILVHGGGVMAGELALKLNIPVQMHEGRRITDAETLRLVTMVYAGWINKNLVAQLNGAGCPALGLSGADADVVPSIKRPAGKFDYGYVGDPVINRINVSFLLSLLRRGLCPVLCSITHDPNAGLLNTNADTLAASVALALAAENHIRLVFCFEKEGVMYEDQPLPVVSLKRYTALKANGIVTAGMIPKLDNAFDALKGGVQQVCIKHALHLRDSTGTFLTL